MENAKLASFIVPFFAACLLAPSVATAMPAAGSNELRLETATYIIPGQAFTNFYHHSLSSEGSNRSDSGSFFGLGLAYGRFVTDNVEIGSSFSLLILSADGDIVAPGATPFLRLWTSVSEKTGLYFAGVLGLQYVSMDGGSATVLTPGVDAGLEFFPVPSWSLRIGPSYRYMHASLSADGSSTSVTMKDHAIGMNWALAGYF